MTQFRDQKTMSGLEFKKKKVLSCTLVSPSVPEMYYFRAEVESLLKFEILP